MGIKYSLIKNGLTENPEDYRAVVQSMEVLTEEDIVKQMIKQGSTTTPADALAVIEDYTLAIENLVELGFNQQTSLFDSRFSIKGVFADGETFDHGVHDVICNLNPGDRLKQVCERMAVELVEPLNQEPDLLKFKDVASVDNPVILTPLGFWVNGMRSPDNITVFFLDFLP